MARLELVEEPRRADGLGQQRQKDNGHFDVHVPALSQEPVMAGRIARMMICSHGAAGTLVPATHAFTAATGALLPPSSLVGCNRRSFQPSPEGPSPHPQGTEAAPCVS